MFEALLDEAFKKAGDPYLKMTPEEHKELVDEFAPWLSIEFEPLIGASQAVLGKEIFKDFQIGLEYSQSRPDKDGLISIPIDISCVYFRRKREDRCISINCKIYRCNAFRGRIDPASIGVELDICGDEEKAAFEEFYKNYKHPIQKLLEEEKIEFFTSYYSDIIGKYKGKSASKKLDEYFTDPNVDNCFSLSKNFIGKVDASEIIRAFILLSALFHSCHGYMEKRKKLDRFESYYGRLA